MELRPIELERNGPTRYRVVVLTSWVRHVSVCDGTHPLPRGGTDLMGPPRECLRWDPPATRVVVLTSWARLLY